MKTALYIVGGVFLLLALRKHTGAAKDGTSKVEEAHPLNGTDWQGSLWDRLSGKDLVSPNHANLITGAQADGGGQVAALTGLKTNWDGSLA